MARQKWAAAGGSHYTMTCGEALAQCAGSQRRPSDHVVYSERGGGLTPATIVNWFTTAYRHLGPWQGARPTRAAEHSSLAPRGKSTRSGGSLRDVQILAGHRSIETTQRYIDGDTDVQRRLVALI